MDGLVPSIHVFAGRAKDVDGRHTGGHDDGETATPAYFSAYGVEPGDDGVAAGDDGVVAIDAA